MANASVTQTYEYTPLTTKRLCRDELAQLALEIQRSEKLSRFEAEREAVQLMHALEDYRDDWDRLAYVKGNRAGLPF